MITIKEKHERKIVRKTTVKFTIIIFTARKNRRQTTKRHRDEISDDIVVIINSDSVNLESTAVSEKYWNLDFDQSKDDD